MAILRTGFVALLLVCAANASQPLESARDQYKAHEDVPHPPQLLSEATDQTADVHQLHHIDPLIKTEHTKKSKVHEKFQSSSTEYQLNGEEKPDDGKSKSKQKSEESYEPRQRRHIDIFGTSRNYYNPWTPNQVSTIVHAPPLQSYSLWQPQVYQISRPYFIPVWGAPGRIPIYFPPQPLFTNPGYPADNPSKEYLPPRGYLPPDTNTPNPPSTSDNSTLFDKFGDIPPVWGTVTVPPSSSITFRPTRRPQAPNERPATHPPLLHNPETSGGSQETATVAPPNSGSAIQRPQTQQRPQAQQRPQSQQRPPAELRPPIQQEAPSGRQPSRCVWAIISCCSGTSEDISYNCFEQLGCTGAFWDTSPCQSDFARAAIANAMEYYNTT